MGYFRRSYRRYRGGGRRYGGYKKRAYRSRGYGGYRKRSSYSRFRGGHRRFSGGNYYKKKFYGMVRHARYQRYKRTPQYAYKRSRWSLRKKNPNPKSAVYWIERAVKKDKTSISKGVERYKNAYEKAYERMQKRAETAKDPTKVFDDVPPPDFSIDTPSHAAKAMDGE